MKTLTLPQYTDLLDPARRNRLDNLIAKKAFKICINGTWRDYVDLFILLKWKLYTLDKIIALSEKKFAGEFHDKLFLEQLTYFDDLEILSTNFIKERYTDDQIKKFLADAVKKHLKKILP